MMKENDEKALIALLATRLHPDAAPDLSRDKIEDLIADSEDVTDDERAVFEAIDPLALIREEQTNPEPIPFPRPYEEADLPMAAGFYRGGEENDTDKNTRDSVNEKRAEIRKRLRKENRGSEGPAGHD